MELRCDTQALKGNLFFDYALNKRNSWRVGGLSDCFYEPSDMDDLSYFLESCAGDEKLFCLGLGSNILVRDAGIRGIVISLASAFSEVKYLEDEGLVYAEAGVTCAKLARFCATNGLQGPEFLAGVPGTVGGALAMNAGAFGDETWDYVNRVKLISRRGEVTVLYPDSFKIAYRKVEIPDECWFVAGYFAVQAGSDPDKLKSVIRSYLRKRNETQPTGESNCGSVFKNPKQGYAARLIESCGLKSFAIGGAQVSAKHANFIINQNDASASDIEQLMRHVQKTVKEKTGIQLELEVKIIGGEEC